MVWPVSDSRYINPLHGTTGFDTSMRKQGAGREVGRDGERHEALEEERRRRNPHGPVDLAGRGTDAASGEREGRAQHQGRVQRSAGGGPTTKM